MAQHQTAVRDPAFFRWHKFIDDVFMVNSAADTQGLGSSYYPAKSYPGLSVLLIVTKSCPHCPSQEYKSSLGEYRDADLSFPGVRVTQVSVQSDRSHRSEGRRIQIVKL